MPVGVTVVDFEEGFYNKFDVPTTLALSTSSKFTSVSDHYTSLHLGRNSHGLKWQLPKTSLTILFTTGQTLPTACQFVYGI